MHPVTERFLLIEWLDQVVIWTCLAACVIGLGLCVIRDYYKVRWPDWVLRGMEIVALIVVVGYMFWRFFLAWKGIYY